MPKIIYVLFVLLVFSCRKEHYENVSLVPMNILPSISVKTTKTLIDESNINSQQIGLQITNSAGNEFYDNQTSYNNILLSNTGSWTLATTVYLSNSSAKIFAYSPYSSNSGDLTGVGSSDTPVARLLNIPSNQPMANQVDYLWAAQDKTTYDGLANINNSNANITLKMNHSLAQVAFVIYKDNYNGEGRLSQIKIIDNSIEPSFRISKIINNDLIMNLPDGLISGGETTSTLTVTEINNTINLTSDPGDEPSVLKGLKNGYFLIAPVSIMDQTKLEFIFTIDDKEYSASIVPGSLNWQKGNQYIFKLKLDVTALSITGLTVTPWLSSDSELSTDYGVNKLANCYIVEPETSIVIPVGIKGNGNPLTIEDGIEVNHVAESMGILWQTPGTSVSLSDFSPSSQTVKVSAASGKGNALIAAYSGPGQTGDILWSWHIWVTDYNPDNQTNGTTYTFTNDSSITYTFMDRNLGALSTTFTDTTDQNALYYQFGRKDPFPGGNYSLPTPVAGQQSVSYSIKNPILFITSPLRWFSFSSVQWWRGARNNLPPDLYPGRKTIYDPCPAGWRVPSSIRKSSPWLGLSISNGIWKDNGWTWSTPHNVGFYPAAGYRKETTGILTAVKSEGRYWTSLNIGVMYHFYLCLALTSTNVTTPASPSARGLPIRCVREN
ncbi:MAG: fimbrillin family protein [Bacteroidales bacterium]|nr:fimbrillin family protein [Bacteroidales bacterium]